jgi:hypothetical protein
MRALLFVTVLGSLAVGCGGAQAPSARGATLASLHDGMQWVRGGDTSEPRVLDPLPAVDALVGARRGELQAQLGSPRTCRMPIEAPCRRAGEILYPFYRGHMADEAGGPVLVIDVDAAGVVTAAHWRRPEVQAPAPMGRTAGGETAVAGTIE